MPCATEDGDGAGEWVRIAARGLNQPVGVAFRDGALYVSEISAISRYDDIEAHLGQVATRTLVRDDFPTEEHHGWKFIAFGPDGWLYVPVGAPCNVCERSDERFASIMRMKPDGSGLELFASGIRNTVGFDWDPRTKELWFTDNGRDMLGDDIPPDELNHAPRAGMHFGFPYFHGMSIADPEFGAGPQRSGLHAAGAGAGAARRGAGDALLQRQRCSRRSTAGRSSSPSTAAGTAASPLGARVSLVRLQDGKAVSYETFAAGWQRADGSRWGRPADVQVMPDGSLLVSDDLAGAVYRITYTAP